MTINDDVEKMEMEMHEPEKAPLLNGYCATDLSQLHYRAILLDDDPTYRRIVARFAEKRPIAITLCENFQQLKEKWDEIDAQVVILDYNLGDDMTGPEVARLLGDTPVLLISRKSNWVSARETWSPNIKNFVHKKYGVPRLLDMAASLAAQTYEQYPLASWTMT